MAAGVFLAIQHIAGTSSGWSGINWVGIGGETAVSTITFQATRDGRSNACFSRA
jgi:hypothetical protein